MMKFFHVVLISLSLVLLGACAEKRPDDFHSTPADYRVNSAVELQAKIDHLNQELQQQFLTFKSQYPDAFSDPKAELDVHNLHTLNEHLVSRFALKNAKNGYCNMMNSYFVKMFQIGHQNLNLVEHLKLKHLPAHENLKEIFAQPENFYQFIINRYTSYRQVQETMNYGCNLKGALEP